MVETTFNIFDAVVVGVVVLSTLLSFFRGFVREFLSLGAWVGASVAALYFAPDVAKSLEGKIDNQLGAFMLASLGTFFVALMVISILNALLMRLFRKGKDVGLLDNFLGLGFGVLRAALLLSLGYYILSFVMPEENFPEWLQASQTRPYVAQGAEILADIAPEYLNDLTPMIEEAQKQAEQKALEKQNSETGYDYMNVEDLERLMDNNQEAVSPSDETSERIQRILQGTRQGEETSDNQPSEPSPYER